MTERHKITLKPEIPRMSWVMSEKHSNKGKQCSEELQNKKEMVYTGILLQGGCKEEQIQPGASFPTGLTLELSEEPLSSLGQCPINTPQLINEELLGV